MTKKINFVKMWRQESETSHGNDRKHVETTEREPHTGEHWFTLQRSVQSRTGQRLLACGVPHSLDSTANVDN